MTTIQLLARLDKRTRVRVLCGRMECDGQIAEIEEYPQEGADLNGKPTILMLRSVRMFPGWAPRRDGVWTLSHYAERRLRKGEQPKLRHTQDRRADGIDLGRVEALRASPDLPIEATCPGCGWRNRLESDVLLTDF